MARTDPNVSKNAVTMRARIQDLEQRNEVLKEALDLANEKVEELQDAQVTIDLLRNEVREWKTRAEELTYGEDMETRVASLEEDLDASEKRVKILEDLKSRLQARIAHLEDDAKKSDAGYEVLLSDYDELKEEMQQLKKEFDCALEENEDLTEEIQTLLQRASGAVPFIKPTEIWKAPEPLQTPNHQELELWLTQMEVYLDKVPIGGDLYSFMVSKLKGVALAHVISTVKAMRAEGTYEDSFATFTKILKARFGDSNPTLNARKKLHALTFTGGKYREYVTETKKLHGHLADHPMSEEDKIFLHLEGIKIKELRDRVEFNPATLEPWKTLEELMAFALPKFGDTHYEKKNGGGPNKGANGDKSGGGSPHGRDNKRRDNTFGFTKHGDKKQRKEFGGKERQANGKGDSREGKEHYGCKLTSSARSWYKENGRCFRCGETHKVSECTASARKLASDLPTKLKEGCHA